MKYKIGWKSGPEGEFNARYWIGWKVIECETIADALWELGKHPRREAYEKEGMKPWICEQN